MFLNLG